MKYKSFLAPVLQLARILSNFKNVCELNCVDRPGWQAGEWMSQVSTRDKAGDGEMRTKVEWFLFWPTSLQISILWKEATINDLMITTERKRWDILLISLDLKLLYDEIQLVGLSQLYRENCEASVQVPSLLAKLQLYSLPQQVKASKTSARD
jgi:hypothetical protein